MRGIDRHWNTRYDGRVLHFPDASSYGKGEVLPAGEGIFAEFRNLPLDSIDRLKRIVTEKPKSVYLGCTNAVYSALADAGIKVNVSGDVPSIRTAELLRDLSKNNFVVENHGRAEVRLYATPGVKISESIKDLSKFDEEVLNTLKKSYAGMNPNEMVKKINGESAPMPENVHRYLSTLTGAAAASRVFQICRKVWGDKSFSIPAESL